MFININFIKPENYNQIRSIMSNWAYNGYDNVSAAKEDVLYTVKEVAGILLYDFPKEDFSDILPDDISDLLSFLLKGKKCKPALIESMENAVVDYFEDTIEEIYQSLLPDYKEEMAEENEASRRYDHMFSESCSI